MKNFKKFIASQMSNVDESLQKMWKNDPSAVKEALSIFNYPPRTMYQQPLIHNIEKSSVGYVFGKSMDECFSRPTWASETCDTDAFYEQHEYPATDSLNVSVAEFAREWSLANALDLLFGEEVETKDTDHVLRLLMEQEHTVTPPQIDEIIELTKEGVNVGLCKDSFGTFCLIETGRESEPVVIGKITTIMSMWSFERYCADLTDVYNPGYRLLIRN